jgi:hypothetical protein
MSCARKNATKKHKRHFNKSQCLLCLIGAFCPYVTFLGLVRTVAIVTFRRGLVIVLPRPWLIFPIICNDFRRFFRRPFVLISALRERSHRHYAEHRNQQYFSQ